MSVVKWSDESKGVVDEKFRQEIEAELAMKRAMLGKDRDTEKEATREATRNVSKSKQRLMMKPKASAMPNDDDFRALSQPRCAQRDSFRVNKFMKEARTLFAAPDAWPVSAAAAAVGRAPRVRRRRIAQPFEERFARDPVGVPAAGACSGGGA
ncbi:hypothetical protein M885DRAFT_190161 [Pelagophyceae sp. CCMP2097]|nr:hypothetical protein M885DRAFT_190161 [Pelagophyceae sp. CCMP2097]